MELSFGIGMIRLYAMVFLRARLYSDAALQLFFLAVQVYGWNNGRPIARPGHGDCDGE